MENLQARLSHHLEKIVIERNPFYASAGHLFAREYIRSHFAKFGPVITHEFEVNGNKHQNLILNIAANEHKQRSPIIIGAHYDTVPACVDTVLITKKSRGDLDKIRIERTLRLENTKDLSQ